MHLFLFIRVDTDEKWRLKLREYVTNTGYGSKQRKQEDSNYDSLIKEILPKGLWGLANMAGDESETEQDPFVMVKEVRAVVGTAVSSSSNTPQLW